MNLGALLAYLKVLVQSPDLHSQEYVKSGRHLFFLFVSGPHSAVLRGCSQHSTQKVLLALFRDHLDARDRIQVGNIQGKLPSYLLYYLALWPQAFSISYVRYEGPEQSNSRPGTCLPCGQPRFNPQHDTWSSKNHQV